MRPISRVHRLVYGMGQSAHRHRHRISSDDQLIQIQSTSSIAEMSSSSNVGISSSSSSSSKMASPSLISLWMRPANLTGSWSEKPEVNSDVSNSNHTKSLIVLSDGSVVNRSFSVDTMG